MSTKSKGRTWSLVDTVGSVGALGMQVRHREGQSGTHVPLAGCLALARGAVAPCEGSLAPAGGEPRRRIRRRRREAPGAYPRGCCRCDSGQATGWKPQKFAFLW